MGDRRSSRSRGQTPSYAESSDEEGPRKGAQWVVQELALYRRLASACRRLPAAVMARRPRRRSESVARFANAAGHKEADSEYEEETEEEGEGEDDEEEDAGD